MPCLELKQNGQLFGYLCLSGPTAENSIRKRHRIKWCFRCRKRLPHMLTMTYEIKPSYYDPQIWWKCSGCGKDCTRF